MANNITLNPGSLGPVVSTVDIGSGIQMPRTRIALGTGGTDAGDISSSNPLPTTGVGTAGTPASGVMTVQGITSMTALKVDGSAVTQPVSGTVTANAGTGTFNVAGTGTAGTPNSGVVTVQGITSMTALKVDGSAVTQPVSGTVTANAGTGTFTVAGTVTSNAGTGTFITGAVQPAATTGTITASAQTVSATTANTTGAVISFHGTYAGVVVAFEASDDSGTTWYPIAASKTDDTAVATSWSLGTNASSMFLVYYAAVTNVRIRSTAYTSGTANVSITTTSMAADPDIVATVTTSQVTAYVDNSVFTDSTSEADAIAGYFNDSASTVTSGNEAAVRITNKRALHVNLRDSSGNEFATNSFPLHVAPYEPAATTGSFTASAQTVTVGSTLYTNGAIVSFNGTYAGLVVAFEVSDDSGTTWYPISATPTGDSTSATTATLGTNASTMFMVYYSAVNSFRVRSTAFTSGTASVRITTIYGADDPDITVTGTGVAGTPATGVVTIQGITSGQPVPISGSISVTNTQTLSAVSQASTNTYTFVTGSSWDTSTTGAKFFGWQLSETGGVNGVTAKIQGSFDNSTWVDQFTMDESANKRVSVDMAIAASATIYANLSPQYEYAVHSTYRYYRVMVESTVSGNSGTITINAMAKA